MSDDDVRALVRRIHGDWKRDVLRQAHAWTWVVLRGGITRLMREHDRLDA